MPRGACEERALKAILGFVSLLVVLAIVAVNARNQLRAVRPPAPASAPADAASAPFGGTSSPSVAQFRRELDKTMRESAERAASAGAEADGAR